MFANRLMNRSTLVLGALAVPALVFGLGAALADSAPQPPAPPPGGPGKAPPPPGDGDRGDRGERGERSKWREQFREELREHPRIARSLVALHETKEHLEKAGHDFGGHKAAAIKAIDEAIKQLKEAIKFDAKQEGAERPAGERPPGGGGGGGKGKKGG